jgi:hypothetical protein
MSSSSCKKHGVKEVVDSTLTSGKQLQQLELEVEMN